MKYRYITKTIDLLEVHITRSRDFLEVHITKSKYLLEVSIIKTIDLLEVCITRSRDLLEVDAYGECDEQCNETERVAAQVDHRYCIRVDCWFQRTAMQQIHYIGCNQS